MAVAQCLIYLSETEVVETGTPEMWMWMFTLAFDVLHGVLGGVGN
jgi:hypothetical protein